jgi:hypothetical protein
MKSFVGFLLVALAIIATATGAIAQDRVVNATIPFDFTAGERFLPAGQYILSSPYANVVEIQSQDKRIVTFVVATHGFAEPASGNQLEFTRYGQQYFLHRILCPVATGMNMRIPSGKPEERVLSHEARLDLGETVFIAARFRD